MTTQIQPLPTPPQPSDTPSDFNSKAFSLLGSLPNFVDQANALGGEMSQLGASACEDAKAAATSAIAAGKSASAAGGSAAGASQSAAQAAGSAAAASQSKSDAQDAAKKAEVIAGGMGAAIAFANTFPAMPATNQGQMIVVTQPHLRFMVWDVAKSRYVRAPWHRPGRIFYTHHNNASEPGALQVRADVSYNQSDYPDLCEVLGLSGEGTFTLLEPRGEFLRVLDNGRGVDVGRAFGSAQGHAMQSHTHKRNAGGTSEAAFTNRQSGGDAAGNPGARTYDDLGAVTGGVSSGATATETRPRNIALPLWVSY